METISIPVYIVRRYGQDNVEVLSAWPDEYEAKFEADRWAQDSKVLHDYTEGTLVVPVEGTANDY